MGLRAGYCAIHSILCSSIRSCMVNCLIWPSTLFNLPVKKFFGLSVVCVTFLMSSTYGQSFFRIEADVSMKTKPTDGKGQLILGRVYYDRSHKKMVYNIRFPEKEVWLIQDSLAYTYRDGKLIRTDRMNPFIEATIFHKCLEGKLADFGLRDSPYKVGKVEKDGDLVITTWLPPEGFPFKGSVLTSSKNNDLYGVVILNEKGEVLSRQLFKGYKVVSGLKVPTEIVQALYLGKAEVYQVITLSNIQINNLKNENFYNYPHSK